MIATNESTIDIYINTDKTDSVALIEIPIAFNYDVKFGAVPVNGQLTDYFKGFLWQFESLYRFNLSGIANGLDCIGVCTFCPVGNSNDSICLGICDFDYYWYEGKCEHCAYYCVQGCQSNGTCSSLNS